MRKKGFMDLARQIIEEHPDGLIGREVAEEALQRDPSLSVAKDPIQSLASTLAKMVRDGFEPGIETHNTRQPIRYFPKAIANPMEGNGVSDPTPNPPGKPAGLPPNARQLSVLAGNAQFRGPLTGANLDLAITLLQQVKHGLKNNG